tara:strand:- start:1504 stop:3051 length:1548 start_codon:yes stop_codon:yes gene_type:complete
MELLSHEDEKNFTSFYESCVKSVLYSIQLLLQKKLNPCPTYVFGSSVDMLCNKNFKIHRMQDLDLMMTRNEAELLITFLQINADIVYKNRYSCNYPSYTLKFNGIYSVTGIKFKSMKTLFELINSLFHESIPDYDYISIENRIMEYYGEDYLFSIDICTSILENPFDVLSKYNIGLLSSKKGFIKVLFDTKTINIVDDDEFGKVTSIDYITKHHFIKYNGIEFRKIKKYDCTVGSLALYFNLINKIFGKNGLIDDDLQIVKKLPKNHNIYDNYNIMKVIFDSNIYYSFAFFKELTYFPPSKNMKLIIGNLNISGSFYNKWVSLLIRIFGNKMVSNCFLLSNNLDDFFIMEENEDKIDVLKNILGKLRMKKIDTTCCICMDEYEMNSPIHICKNGHITHLCCSGQQLRLYLISILNRYNSKLMGSIKERSSKLCPICKCDYYDFRPDTELIDFNHRQRTNPKFSSITQNHDDLKEFNIYEHPIDMYIEEPEEISNNLFFGSPKKYIEERYCYLKKF